MAVPVPSRKKTQARAGRIAIVGRPNVGKSTLLNVLVGEPIAIISRHPQTTRDRILGIVTDGQTQFVFVDTPGIHDARNRLGERMNHEAAGALEGADAILFLTDVPNLKPPSAATPMLRPPAPEMRPADLAIVESFKRLGKGVPIVLVLNKIDRVKAKADLLPVLETYAKAYDWTAIVPVSALRKDGTKTLLEALRPLCPVSPPLFEDDVISDKPTRFFVAEFVREQILRRTREEVPHGIAVTIDRFDEGPKVPIIELAVIVNKESHKRIVIGKGGALLKEIGIAARRRVEKLLGKQVHLKIWVRVDPGWSESDAKLASFGYGRDS